MEVSTSVLSVEDIKTIYNLEVAKTDYFHIDVMDGKFVKNNTVEKMMSFSTEIKHVTNVPLDIHLMVEDVESFVSAYEGLLPNIITFHYEANTNEKVIMNRIKLIKDINARVGISIKPKTEVSEIFKFLPFVHVVLVMTVEPGEGGQKLISETVHKISTLKDYIAENDLEVDIEADGGINTENVSYLKESGVSVVVAGTAIVNSQNMAETISKLRGN